VSSDCEGAPLPAVVVVLAFVTLTLCVPIAVPQVSRVGVWCDPHLPHVVLVVERSFAFPLWTPPTLPLNVCPVDEEREWTVRP